MTAASGLQFPIEIWINWYTSWARGPKINRGIGVKPMHKLMRDDIGANIQPGWSLTARFSALEHTKAYDLLAALPLIVWYGVGVATRLPALVQEILDTNFGAIDLNAILGLISKLATSVFLSTLIALLIFRDKPRAKAKGLMPRVAAAAGTYLGVGMVLLPPIHLSNLLCFTSTALVIAGTTFALYSALCPGSGPVRQI
jgi:hypothetical protein